ncbi:helix-turn-helix domain-containing protein [Paenibacillus medicaginis]|uniref:Helix-turn-helix domain-containing protein n=1 Tax=Paenibacillus medicaginis TaxID=1470560 RepID=A0ABV5CCA1_9BACL
MSDLRQLVGTRIRAMRNAKGLTQQKLADIAGLDYRYIGALERGERNFSIDTLEKVLIALNVSLSELMYSDSEIDNDESLKREAIDEFIGIVSMLNEKQIRSIRNINIEFKRAF